MSTPAAVETTRGRAERREPAATIALIVLGAGGIVFTASRSWLAVTGHRLAPFTALRVSYSGRNLYPALNGLAVVALLIAVLVLVSGGWARRALGALLGLTGLSTGWYAARGLSAPTQSRVRGLLGSRLSQQDGQPGLSYHPFWSGLTLLLSVLLIVAAAVLVARGGRWQVGLSRRYAAPADAAKSADPWRRLDRGEDPTINDG